MGQDRFARACRHGHFGALGDIHGEFAAARAIIARHPEIPFWLCVGDIADQQGRYEPLGAPVYWIHGNNDNFDAIAAGDLPADLRHIDNGTAVTIAGSEDPAYDLPGSDAGRVCRPGISVAGLVRAQGKGPGDGAEEIVVAGLGGTFAPTWYEAAAADLPHPTLRQAQGRPERSRGAKKGSAKATELADKRRHFIRDEVDACRRLRDVDIFMSHEAAKPFRPFPGGRGPDAGKAPINEVLAAMKPRLHLFGHHHRFSDETREGVRSVGLDLVTRSYLLIDAGSLDISVKSL